MPDPDVAARLIGDLERELRELLERLGALETLVAAYETLLGAIIEIREAAG